MSEKMKQKWLSDKQMAAHYNVSRTWVWEMAKRDDDFPKPIKFTNGCTRFSRESVEAYDAKKENSHS